MKTAIFLVGGPGSGKDLLLKKVFEFYNFNEFNIDQIKPKKFYSENMVVVANAYDFEKIENAKIVLEKCYYKTSMVFVDVSDSVSKSRLNGRSVNEEVRKEKHNISRNNYDKFVEIFDHCFYFDNSYEILSQKMITQFMQLDEEIKNLLETPLNKFKKKIKAKIETPYNPLPTTKDGINPTYDTRAAGNGDLIKNYQYEAFDPNPLDSGVGFGSNMGNYSKQEPMAVLSSKETGYDKNDKPIFKRIKKIIFKKKNA